MSKLLAIISLLLISCFTISCKTTQLQSSKVENKVSLIKYENFKSEYIRSRNIDVWVPEDYSESTKYSVLYMHDGQMLFDSSATWNNQEWGVDEMITRLMQENKIKPTIVVGMWNTEDRHPEYFPQKPFESLPEELRTSLLDPKLPKEKKIFKREVNSDSYLKFIVYELKPFIDSNYSTLTSAEHTSIMGSSMGGLISMYALCEYPEVFGNAACLSTHWIGTVYNLHNPMPDAFASYLSDNLPLAGNNKIYFDYGTEALDSFYEPYQKNVDSIMRSRGYNQRNWKTMKFEGHDHSEKSWGNRLHIPLEFLLGI